jgi:REP element-mobilizing transposase RayT
VLVGQGEKRLRQLLHQKAKEWDAEIHALEIMPDHVHWFVESDPRLAPAHFAAQCKEIHVAPMANRVFLAQVSMAQSLESKFLRGQHGHRFGIHRKAVHGQSKDPCGRRLSIGYSRPASIKEDRTFSSEQR